jgi:hypothetical protein
VRDVIGDRARLPEHARDLRALTVDVVVDLVLSSGRQARELMSVFRGATSRVVALSSCEELLALPHTFGLPGTPAALGGGFGEDLSRPWIRRASLARRRDQANH